jgi:hypothetical protein
MSQTIKLKRGLEANRSFITPNPGELIVTTDNNELFMGDGNLEGGLEIGYLNTRTGGTVAELVVTGNLTVNGTTTTVNSNDVNIGDAAILLNSDLADTSAPSEDSGFIVNRGSANNVSVLWDETNDFWAISNGTASYRILSEQDTMIKTILGDSGIFSAGSFNDAINIVGTGSISTSISGDTLTISGANTASSGTLDVTVAADAPSGSSIYITTGTGFNADTANDYVYDIHVGPSIVALADTMTGPGSLGFLKKTGADTFTLDNSVYDNYVSWSIGADSGVDQDVSSGYALSINGGTDLETSVSANNVSVSHSPVSRTNTTNSTSTTYGGSFTVVDSIISSATGHIKSVNVKTVTLPASDDTTYAQAATSVTNGAGFDLIDSDSTHDVIHLLGNVEEDGSGVIVTQLDSSNIRARIDVIDGGTF